MRTVLITAALLLAACSPQPSDQSAETAATNVAETPVNPDTAALGGAPQTGSWTLRTDEGLTAAGFGAPESEYQLVITCEAPSGNLSVMAEREVSPDQDTTLRIITAVQSIDLPARSFNEGLPSVTADVADNAATKTPLISMLGAPTDRFAVDIAGEVSVFPWHESIAQALTACR